MPAEKGAAGEVIAGRYVIETELARGGMGVVFRVADQSSGRVLALKRSLETRGTSAALFEREYRTLVSLRHPRIVEVYDFGLDERGPFYTMELLDGTDLRARSPLDWREVCAKGREIASSLALLHSRRLLHRDVSAANIRLTSEGRAKLIDFGTLTSFGRCREIAGTPSGIAPESLEGVDLDHRVDLFAFGATAYYALTGRHAYPAGSLRELDVAWRRGAPLRPSAMVAGIPHELDELVLSLLSLDRALRPQSAAEVIDRLGAIAGLSPEEDDRVAQSYLVSQELVGREKQFARLRARLEHAIAGEGSALLVQGPSGHGRTALLRRFESEARVDGATVLVVNARARQRPFRACHALLQRALAEAPDRAAALARRLLPDPEEPAPESSSSGRLVNPRETTVRAELRDWAGGFEAFFTALAVKGAVTILIDDLHLADGESLPLLAALAKAASGRKLLLVASVDTEDPGRDRAGIKLFERSAGRLRVRPFSLEQTEQLVATMFGEISSTKRVAAWLHQQTSGSPLQCTELLAHLVKQGRIHYAEGTWVLPHEFPDEDVRSIIAAAVRDRLGRLRPRLRRFAECLSPHRRSFDVDLCRGLCAGDAKLANIDVRDHLDELCCAGVLVGDDGEYVFAQPRVRDILHGSLDDERRRRLHRAAAEYLAPNIDGNAEREAEVGLHLLLAGDRGRAGELIANSMVAIAAHPDALVRAVPELKELYREYVRIGVSEDELLQVTAPLVVSGYYVDPTVHDEFGNRTAELLYERTGFALASRLGPFIGSYPALFVGVMWGLVRFVWTTRSVRLMQFSIILLSFVGVCAARSAVAYLRLESSTHQLLLRVLSPAKGLHRHNAVRLVYDLIAIAFAESRGAFGDVYDGYTDQLARLPYVRLFEENTRHHYEAGLLCSFGRCQLLRMGDGALECADRVTEMGGEHDRVLAQFLRCSYHLYRGETVKAREAEEILDAMAAQYGHRWVPDVLAVSDLIPYHLSADVVGLKRVLHRTERVLGFAPTFALYRDVVRAMYEGHRGRPEVAVAMYDELWPKLVPFTHPVWSYAHAHRAECLNALGRHREALTFCQEALERVGPLARVYVVAYQQLEREAAIAKAELGQTTEAARTLDELLELHVCDSHPLLLGLLNRDRARVARIAHDGEAFERYAQRTCAEFSRTENPILLGQARRLAQLPPQHVPDVDLRAGAGSSQEASSLLKSVAGATLDVLARRALEYLLSLSGTSRGYLYLLQNGVPILFARHGAGAAMPPLETQVERLLSAYVDESEATKTTSGNGPNSGELLGFRLLPLVVAKANKYVPVGAAAVFESDEPRRLSFDELQRVAAAIRASAITVHESDLPSQARNTT